MRTLTLNTVVTTRAVARAPAVAGASRQLDFLRGLVARSEARAAGAQGDRHPVDLTTLFEVLGRIPG